MSCELTHVFSDAQDARVVTTTLKEATEIGLAIERIAEERTSLQDREIQLIKKRLIGVGVGVPSKK